MANDQILQGVVRGGAIHLDTTAGLTEGQRVTIVVKPELATNSPGEGLKEAFGGWDDDIEGLDAYLASVRDGRKASRREIEQ